MFTINVRLPIENLEPGDDVLHEVLNDVPSLNGFAPSPNSARVIVPEGEANRPWWDSSHPVVQVEFDTEEEARLWWSQLMGFPVQKP